MTGAKRIQYVRGKALPMNAAYVGRGSRWGNPFRLTDPRSFAERTEVVRRYRDYLHEPAQARLMRAVHTVLPGLDLACWCRPDGLPCHADVLLELANPPGTIHLPRPGQDGCHRHRIPSGQRCALCLDQATLWDLDVLTARPTLGTGGAV